MQLVKRQIQLTLFSAPCKESNHQICMLFSLQLPLPLVLIRAHFFEIELIVFFLFDH